MIQQQTVMKRGKINKLLQCQYDDNKAQMAFPISIFHKSCKTFSHVSKSLTCSDKIVEDWCLQKTNNKLQSVP